MHKSSIVALLPVCCLAVTASAAHLFNNSRHQVRFTPPEEPGLVVHSVEDQHIRGEIGKALDQMIQAYREKGFKGLESRTTPDRWLQWQKTPIRKALEWRVKLLGLWTFHT